MVPFSRGKFSSPNGEVVFLIFVINILHLGWLGGKTVESPFFIVAQVSTVAYFFSTMLLIPSEFEMDIVFSKLLLLHYVFEWKYYIYEGKGDSFILLHARFYDDWVGLTRMFPKQGRVPTIHKNWIVRVLCHF